MTKFWYILILITILISPPLKADILRINLSHGKIEEQNQKFQQISTSLGYSKYHQDYIGWFQTRVSILDWKQSLNPNRKKSYEIGFGYLGHLTNTPFWIGGGGFQSFTNQVDNNLFWGQISYPLNYKQWLIGGLSSKITKPILYQTSFNQMEIGYNFIEKNYQLSTGIFLSQSTNEKFNKGIYFQWMYLKPDYLYKFYSSLGDYNWRFEKETLLLFDTTLNYNLILRHFFSYQCFKKTAIEFLIEMNSLQSKEVQWFIGSGCAFTI
ncbi:MAG: hypothetical protein N2450_03840 [bacterium]|nr:hypothetical protein [bacterium]